MTGEGWTTIMYILWNGTNTMGVSLFFIVMILLLVFFSMNLFLAVISDSFEKVFEQETIAKREKDKVLAKTE